jgi:hypothetical protein
LALAWAELPPPANSLRRARRLEAVRHFARFYSAFEPRTQIPPAGLFGPAYRRVPVPIYTPPEIGALLQAARQLPTAQSRRPLTFATLLGVNLRQTCFREGIQAGAQRILRKSGCKE